MPRHLLATAVLTLGASTIFAADWPRFRGPNGSGVADSAAPTEFGRGKNMDWRTEVPLGRSSPVVVGDRVYLTAAEGDKLITLALDRKTGRTQWRREIVRDRAQKIYVGNSTATATPTSDGSNVYAFFGDLGLVSYSLEGNERWRTRLGPFDSYYGMSASPVLLGDSLFLVCDQNSGSFIVAVDRNTGRQRWRKERPTAKTEGYSTPVIVTPAVGQPQLVVPGAHRLDAYDPATGEIVWWVGRQGIYPIATPALGDGVVFAASSGAETPTYPTFDNILQTADKDRDGKLASAELGSMSDYRDHFGWLDINKDGFVSRDEWEARRRESVAESGLVAIATGGRGDRTATQLLWRDKRTYSNYSAASPLLYDSVLYMVKDGGIMTSLNPATGAVYKVGRLGNALGEYFSSPVAAGGRLYFTSVDGVVTVVNARPQWDIVATNDLGEPTQATPAVADGHLYIRTHKALYSFSAPGSAQQQNPSTAIDHLIIADPSAVDQWNKATQGQQPLDPSTPRETEFLLSLTPTERLGAFRFKQRCIVCHGRQMSLQPNTWGPILTKKNVEGREDVVRRQISEGSPRMPAFKYALQPSDVDAIVQYLKKVDTSPM